MVYAHGQKHSERPHCRADTHEGRSSNSIMKICSPAFYKTSRLIWRSDSGARGDAGFTSRRRGEFGHVVGIRAVKSPFLAIIDDDEALCSSLVDLMRSVGHLAEPFASAEMFLGSFHLLNVDCIIADVHMPGMSGVDLLRELHAQGIMTPVILITGLPDKQLDDDAISAGALCLLRKPFKTDSLLDYVERSLR
jgi:CheY-like chemotaxis protein